MKDSVLRNAICNQEFVNKAYDGVKVCQEDKRDCGSEDCKTQTGSKLNSWILKAGSAGLFNLAEK